MEISVAIDDCNPAPGSYLQGTFTVRLPIKYDDNVNQSNDSIALYSDDELKLAVPQYQARVKEIVKKIDNLSTNQSINQSGKSSILSPSNFQFNSPRPANHYRSINPTFDLSYQQQISQSVQQSIDQLIEQTIHRNQLIDSLHVQVLGKILIDKRKVNTKPFQIFRPIHQSTNRAIINDSSFIMFDSPRVRITAKQLIQDYTQIINQSISQSNDLFITSPSNKHSPNHSNNQSLDPTLLTYDFSCWLPASLPPSFSNQSVNQSIKLVYYVSITAFGQSINQSGKQMSDPSVLGEIRLPFTVKTSPRFFLAYRNQSIGQSISQSTDQPINAVLEGTIATRINYALLLSEDDHPNTQSINNSTSQPISRLSSASTNQSRRPSLNIHTSHQSINHSSSGSDLQSLTVDLSSINQSINQSAKVDQLITPTRLLFTPASITRTLTQVMEHQFDCLIVPDQHSQPIDQSASQSINQSDNQSIKCCDDLDESFQKKDDQSVNQSVNYDELSASAWNDACSEIQGLGSINQSDSNPVSLDQSINQFVDGFYRPQSFQISDSFSTIDPSTNQSINQSIQIVKVQLQQSTFRVGDLIQGSLDFSDHRSISQSISHSINRFPCIRVVCRLVWTQKLDPSINKQAINQSISQTEHGSFHQYTLHATKTTFSLQIPNNQAISQSVNQSNFMIDSLVTGYWELQFKFIVRKPKPSTYGSWFWRSSVNQSVNQSTNQSIDLNNSVEHCIPWSLPLDVWPVSDDSESTVPASKTLCLPAELINPSIKRSVSQSPKR